MKRLIQPFHNEALRSAALIVFLAAFTYLPFVSGMTYYGDDWHIAWGGHTFGSWKVANIYSTDRPFMGIVYSINYLMLGDRPLNWQLYAVLQRTIGGLAFFWIVRMLWPRQKLATTLMAVLFAVYPGFLLMPNASTYQTLLFGINLGLLSIGCTLRFLLASSRREKIWMAALTCLLAMGCVFMFEWFIGLEFLRAALIWYVLTREKKWALWRPRVRALMRACLPAASGVALFVFWRVVFFRNRRHATSLVVVAKKYVENPVQMVLRVPAETLRSFGETVFSAWIAPLYRLTQATQDYLQLLLIGLGGALSAALLIGGEYYLGKHAGQPSAELSDEPDLWEVPAMLIGAPSIFVALLLVVALDRGVSLNGDTYDRYTLTSMPGASMLLIGALFLGIRSRWGRIGAVAVFVALAGMTHFANASRYAATAAFQRQFWWQLSWRAPDLHDGTVLMPSIQPYDFVADYDIFPEANLIYRPGGQKVNIRAEVLNRDTAILAMSGVTELRVLRTISFVRNFRNLLVASYGYTNGQSTCMHLIDGKAIELSLDENPYVSVIASYSKIGQVYVNAQPHTPPPVFFGPEPPHTWCYYYEKASLARQQGDWQEAARLGDEAIAWGYTPGDPVEWMPLLEAYANMGRAQDVQRIATAFSDDESVRKLICQRFAPNAQVPANYRSPAAFHMISTDLCQGLNPAN